MIPLEVTFQQTQHVKVELRGQTDRLLERVVLMVLRLTQTALTVIGLEGFLFPALSPLRQCVPTGGKLVPVVQREFVMKFLDLNVT